jgi:hypothetical protein
MKETKSQRLQGGAVLLSPQAFSSTCSAADTAACSGADKWPATLVFLAHLVLTLAHPSAYVPGASGVTRGVTSGAARAF